MHIENCTSKGSEFFRCLEKLVYSTKDMISDNHIDDLYNYTNFWSSYWWANAIFLDPDAISAKTYVDGEVHIILNKTLRYHIQILDKKFQFSFRLKNPHFFPRVLIKTKKGRL